MGAGGLHPMQQVCICLPPRGYPRQGVRSQGTRPGAGGISIGPLHDAGIQGAAIHAASGARRLHRVQCSACRSARQATRSIPRNKAINMTPRIDIRDRERDKYAFFLNIPEFDRSTSSRAQRQDHPIHAADVRIFRRLRRLRRNAVHQSAHAIVRRSPADRQRHRLLFDLRRESADHAIYHRSQRPRAGMVEFAVRGQRRIRPRHRAGRGRA